MFNYNEYDNIYSINKNPTFGTSPTEELRRYIKKNKLIGNALDIGCGDGRDTLFLAKSGWYVSALDYSKVALQKLMKFAEIYGVSEMIFPLHYDAINWDYPIDFFNLVISITCLDHIPKKYHGTILEKITRSLKIDGILFLEVHSTDDPGCENKKYGASEFSKMIQHYFNHNELKEMIEFDFNIIQYKEYMVGDNEHGKSHVHGIVRVIARKKDLRK